MGKFFLALFILTTITAIIVHKISKITIKLSAKTINEIPIIIWWTPFTDRYEYSRNCNRGECKFTQNREFFANGKSKTILFYGSDFSIEDLPLPREREMWGLLHEESPKNNPILNHESTLNLFHTISSFNYNSDMPLTLQYLQRADKLLSKEFFKPFKEKHKIAKRENLSPIIYLQSDCDTPSKRDEYVKTLSSYISVDSYGQCLNNKKLDKNLIGIEAMNSELIYNLISKYKFTLAFENYACEDYITEKLWRPLQLGSVPIYWGSPTVQDWIPNPNSIIDVRKFENSRELASLLQNLTIESDKYETFLEHKVQNKISNSKLLSELESRKWGINEDQLTKDTYVEAFECLVCDRIYSSFQNISLVKDFLNKKRNGCPPPETVLRNADNKYSTFNEEWYWTRVESQLLEQYVLSKKQFNIKDFHETVLQTLHANGHFVQFPVNRFQ